MKKLLLVLIIFSQTATGQKLSRQDKAMVRNLKSEIGFLASDQLEGRRTGTPGEKLAYEYLAGQFKSIGLLPKGDAGSYLQAFEVNEGKEMLPGTTFAINGKALQAGEDFFPFVFGSEGTVNAFASPAINEKGSPWFFNVSEALEENKDNPHFDLLTYMHGKMADFAKKGATACIVFNPGKKDDGLKFDGKSRLSPVPIPVVYISQKVAKEYLGDVSNTVKVELNVKLGDKKRSGHNVVGFIDNGAPYTIVLGAHYDHLGYGEDHNSLWTGKPEIHNGADDNASGTASMLELARWLKKAKLKNNNYLIICFSGEELGLYGSKYFTEHPTIPLETVSYMINCDMVGRLNEATHAITIGGYGTSPSWGTLLPQKTKAIEVKFDSSGIGPSDHTSFYLKDIPVLFFFTGVHPDYHKPSDDADKINYAGEVEVIRYIQQVLKETNKKEKLTFQKTREPQTQSVRFTVSLGIMPDYTFSGTGVRADGIIDGKIAQHIGMQAGDVIVKLGNFTVTDINDYMTALSKFKKGDATKISVQRGKETLVLDVVF